MSEVIGDVTVFVSYENTKCPKCGSVQVSTCPVWKCGSWIDHGYFRQVNKCRISELETQLAVKDAEIAAIRKACPCNCHNQPSSKEAMGLEEHKNCGECMAELLSEAESLSEQEGRLYQDHLKEKNAEIARLRETMRQCLSWLKSYNRDIARDHGYFDDLSNLILEIEAYERSTAKREPCQND